MPCFEGDFRMVGQLVEEVIVSKSRIITSEVDMAGKKITSVSIPSDPYDAANKLYVDLRTSEIIQVYDVTLVGTVWTEVVNIRRGAKHVVVESLVTNGPMLFAVCLKVKDSRNAVINDLGSSRALPTGERLEVGWPPNSPLRLRKTGENYNGLYRVKIF